MVNERGRAAASGGGQPVCRRRRGCVGPSSNVRCIAAGTSTAAPCGHPEQPRGWRDNTRGGRAGRGERAAAAGLARAGGAHPCGRVGARHGPRAAPGRPRHLAVGLRVPEARSMLWLCKVLTLIRSPCSCDTLADVVQAGHKALG